MKSGAHLGTVHFHLLFQGYCFVLFCFPVEPICKDRLTILGLTWLDLFCIPAMLLETSCTKNWFAMHYHTCQHSLLHSNYFVVVGKLALVRAWVLARLWARLYGSSFNVALCCYFVFRIICKCEGGTLIFMGGRLLANAGHLCLTGY